MGNLGVRIKARVSMDQGRIPVRHSQDAPRRNDASHKRVGCRKTALHAKRVVRRNANTGGQNVLRVKCKRWATTAIKRTRIALALIVATPETRKTLANSGLRFRPADDSSRDTKADGKIPALIPFIPRTLHANDRHPIRHYRLVDH